MTSIRLTVKDLEGLPEDDGNRYELIDGVLHVTRQPHWEHQNVCLAIGAALRGWSRETGLGVANLAPGVIFSEDTAVAPDVVWVSSERMAVLDRESGKLTGAPDLVVEVLSPGGENEARDRKLKLDLYSRRGVREYWIVDWRRGSLEVFRRVEAVLTLDRTLHPEDELASPLLPGFRCSVGELLPG